jgi:hypothetical protein
MQAQPSDSSEHARARAEAVAPEADESAAEAAVMGLLLSGDHHGPWSKEELVREIGSSRLEATDAIASLAGAGLVHELEDFVLASRAAQRMDKLEL